MNISRKITHAAIASSISLLGIVGLSTPASAWDSQSCGDKQRKEYDTPGVNVILWAEPCVQRSGNSSRAVVYLSWLHGDGTVNDFDAVDGISRLEKNNSFIETTACFFTYSINNNHSGRAGCETKWHSGRGFTADGKFVVDINNDGEGPRAPWEIHGSPVY